VKVTVNDVVIVVHRGATVLDALRRYSPQAAERVLTGACRVEDDHGYLVATDGALSEGDRLTVEDPPT